MDGKRRGWERRGEGTGGVGAEGELVDGCVEVAWSAALFAAGLFAVWKGGGAAGGSAPEFGPDVELGRGRCAGGGEVVACLVG